MTTTVEAEHQTTTPDDTEPEHIACDCRPLVTLCGAYDDSPWSEQWNEAACCKECVRVLYEVGCPGCGCRVYEGCQKCDPVP